MNALQEVKEWCDKEQKEQPAYVCTGSDTSWVCIATAEWITDKMYSDKCTNKKLAKHNVAAKLWSIIKSNEKTHYSLSKNTMVLIDGDQRIDCWSYLNKVTWDNMDVTAFVSPTSHTLKSDKIKIVKAKTTSRDSADALILITLGRLLESFVSDGNIYDRFLVVSADHILVQAAMDTDYVDWASNLDGLKEYLQAKQSIKAKLLFR